MTNEEYITISNLTRMRTLISILTTIIVNNENEKDWKKIIRLVSKMEAELFSRIKIIEEEEK